MSELGRYDVKVTCYFVENEGTEEEKITPWNELSEEEVEDIKKGWSKRLSRAMSEFYNTHPAEKERILKEY